ncbi:similar to queuine tRNA ribosyltransferase, putative [Ectocarpus siliculosus]|uniref:Queuine tRNA-ribosyltransferase catalytic subunit 1 n=1 Tax=Ectocarpus siliculosus TaxID=2880 RepID=D7FNG2_ECTSI|nr:similar to queuine tRNA ribosyltransferase, putative [Ectocarpus siliculosus]|eukprot:CBJ25973.1 similar to queuine tRNA ribosyltransferase, putative [Ectocarpus siliculosus]
MHRSYPNFSFTVESECQEGTKARTGTVSTPHGLVQTPAFIFCATKAAIKGLSAETMKECGSQIILSNTYHLLVQPGGEMIEKMGGLQKATRWEGPMLTDSGGYQIFSMGHGSVGNEIKGRRGAEGGAEFAPSLVSISEKGARFKSYYDCSIKSLTPERSIEIQRQLGADLVVVLDECTPFHVDKDYTKSSMHRTHRWAMRSLREFIDGDDGTQALYGIIQGGVYPDLRNEAVEFVNKAPFFGIAVGGSLGADKATMHQVVSHTMANVRRDRPVHLLGIGGIADIFHGVRQGVDTFDCVHPTRLGRHGGALVKASFWTREQELEEERANQDAAAEAAAAATAEEEASIGGDTMAAGVGASKRKKRRRSGDVRKKRHPVVPREHVNLLKGRYREDHRVIDEDCGCPTCRGGYTRAYINHLGRAGELLGGMLVSQHNVFFMNELMTSIRTAIAEGRLAEEEDKWLAPGLRARDFHKRAAAEAAAAEAVKAAAGEESGESHH